MNCSLGIWLSRGAVWHIQSVNPMKHYYWRKTFDKKEKKSHRFVGHQTQKKKKSIFPGGNKTQGGSVAH